MRFNTVQHHLIASFVVCTIVALFCLCIALVNGACMHACIWVCVYWFAFTFASCTQNTFHFVVKRKEERGRERELRLESICIIFWLMNRICIGCRCSLILWQRDTLRMRDVCACAHCTLICLLFTIMYAVHLHCIIIGQNADFLCVPVSGLLLHLSEVEPHAFPPPIVAILYATLVL